jgi:hypothetical protein
MNTQHNVASFLIRFVQDVWHDLGGEPRVRWRGQVSHVQSDEEAAFTDFAQVVAFIQEQLTRVTLEAIPAADKPDQDKILRESFRLWEQFAQSYSGLIFEALESSVKQSHALGEQLEEAFRQALSRSYKPASTDKDLTALIARLGAQVKILEEKVARLEQAGRE